MENGCFAAVEIQPDDNVGGRFFPLSGYMLGPWVETHFTLIVFFVLLFFLLNFCLFLSAL